MLLKMIIVSFLGVVIVCDVAEPGDLLPFELLVRVIRGISSSRQRLRPRIPFPRQPSRPARPRFPRPPQLVSPDVGAPTAMADPTDISNMLGGRCTKESTMNLEHMFKDMFVSNSDLDTVVSDAKNSMRNHNRKNGKKKAIIESTRISRKIGRVNSGNSRGSVDCCETEMRMTAPYTVLESRRRMQVVHLNSSYQFVHEGVCVNPQAKCQRHGECVQVYKYSYMLLYDADLVNMYPPVRFGRVQVKSHCECMNIGG